MKRPKKIRKGDIFVDECGRMRIILSTTPIRYDLVTSLGNIGGGYFSMLSLLDFKRNSGGFSEYYLGNIMDIKPKGKF